MVFGPLSESFRVLTYDRRGHSRSERPAGQGSVHEDIADLAALVEHLGLAPAHIAGNSFGASIVLGCAAKNPGLFRSLIAHEPPLFSVIDGEPKFRDMLRETKARIGSVIERLKQGDMAGGAEQFVNTVAFGPGAWERLPAVTKETFISNAVTFLDEANDPDALSIDLKGLSKFTRPELISHGDSSPPFFSPIAAGIAKSIPGSTQKTITGAGHVPHLSHPTDYVAMVKGFVQSVRAKGKPGARRR